MKKYNCFSCSGTEKEKKCYTDYDKQVCYWKLVANEDVIKYNKGDEFTTLTTMLNEYLEQSKEANKND